MPATIQRRQPVLYGPNGRPVASYLYPSPRTGSRQYRPRTWVPTQAKQAVNSYDRRELINYSRQLFAQIGNLSTAIQQKNCWAFGDAWDPIYQGSNKAWGEEATEFLREQFYPMANVRGPQYDFRRSLTISGQLWDIDGDDLMVLTSASSGFPQIAFYPSHRISSQAGSTTMAFGNQDQRIRGGEFDGARIQDGIILDRNSRMIGVRLVNEEDDGYTDIPSQFCDLAYLPQWHDQCRGIPRIATCLLRWMDLQDIDDFLRKGMKRASAIGLKFKTETGEAGTGDEVLTAEDITDTSGETRSVTSEEIQGGEIYYLNSNTGEEIEAINYQNPHPNAEAFVERVTRECVASVGWLFELLDLTETGRAPTRMACEIANQSIWAQQVGGYRRAKRAVVYAIAKAMKSGLLSKNNDGLDPYRWEFLMPKPLSVDAGNDEQADRENLKIGTTSKTIIAAKKGFTRQEIEKDRRNELDDLCQMCRDAVQKNTELTFEKAFEFFEQRGPNPVSQNAAPESNSTMETEEDDDDETPRNNPGTD